MVSVRVPNLDDTKLQLSLRVNGPELLLFERTLGSLMSFVRSFIYESAHDCVTLEYTNHDLQLFPLLKSSIQLWIVGAGYTQSFFTILTRKELKWAIGNWHWHWYWHQIEIVEQVVVRDTT
jgi:hypothetical protein